MLADSLRRLAAWSTWLSKSSALLRHSCSRCRSRSPFSDSGLMLRRGDGNGKVVSKGTAEEQW